MQRSATDPRIADDVLRLVTCAGAFDRGARSDTDNLVVHAVRV